MEFKVFIAVIIVGIGTFLLRYVPLKVGINKIGKGGSGGILTELLEVSGVSIIAALLAGSVLSPGAGVSLPYYINVMISSGFVVITCVLWKNPGISVLTGIVSFALINLIL